MSSPILPPSFEGIFDNVQGHGTPHILSSPVQSAFPAFDPTSPFTSIRKTPNDRGLRARMRTTEGFLISPMTSNQANMRSLQSTSTSTSASGSIPSFSTFQDRDRTRTPTLGFKPISVAATPVQIADPNSQPDWEGIGMDFSNLQPHSELNLNSFDDIPFGSTYKAPQTETEASTPTTVSMPEPTPTHSPVAPRSGHKKTRTLSGLGTPSGVHRSAKRIRQATYDMNSMPVSPSARRRVTADHSSSLTTSVPLSRAVSGSSIYLGPPGATYPQDRNVSSSSAMTASTSYEIMSPSLQAFHPEMMFNAMPISTSLPELMPSASQMPSPNLSGGRSPICTPQHPAGLFYTSPETEQNSYMGNDVQGDMTLMSHVMSSMPQSSSMASVSSFPGNQGFRQNTLTTIVETPSMAQEPMMYSAPPSTHLPSQSSMPMQQHFQPMEYPSVPGLSLNYQPGPSQPLDIQAWSAQTYTVNHQLQSQHQHQHQQHMFNFHPPPMPSAPQRHASASFLNYSMQSNEVPVFPNVPRSVSAPFVPTMSSVPPPLPHSLSQGGLFGPGPSTAPMTMENNGEVSWNRSTPVSPETPRKRQTYPPVGKRLKPGPKPKPKTPKKGKESSTEPSAAGGGIDPSLLAGAGAGAEAVPPLPRESSPKPVLVFGPDLSVAVMQRTASGNSIIPPGGQAQAQAQGQPQLVIQPPRNSQNSNGNPSDPNNATGLPRAFLEKLYTTFLTLDGSITGQPVKRFKCLIEGCERHFPRKSAIHSHIQTHLEDKPYICQAEDCHAAFVRQHDLRRHTRIHSGTKPFPCPCGKGFARGDALMRHRQRGICSGSLVPRRDEM